jgi:hypothetical protein
VEIFTKHPPDESNEELQQCMGIDYVISKANNVDRR